MLTATFIDAPEVQSNRDMYYNTTIRDIIELSEQLDKVRETSPLYTRRNGEVLKLLREGETLLLASAYCNFTPLDDKHGEKVWEKLERADQMALESGLINKTMLKLAFIEAIPIITSTTDTGLEDAVPETRHLVEENTRALKMKLENIATIDDHNSMYHLLRRHTIDNLIKARMSENAEKSHDFAVIDDNAIYTNPAIRTLLGLTMELDEHRRCSGIYRNPDGIEMMPVRDAETRAMIAGYMAGSTTSDDMEMETTQHRRNAQQMALEIGLADKQVLERIFEASIPHMEFADDPECKADLEDQLKQSDYPEMLGEMFYEWMEFIINQKETYLSC